MGYGRNEENALREIRQLERALEQAIRALRVALNQLREIEENFEDD
ncbi:hypothetical protein P9761_06875 [Brevibacillus centrosporus]|nr:MULTISPECIES: hypothetical protein [Brevibacillus]MED1795741.1 hypothetical protein [Brevibacillus nitrificans]MED1953517.1 hypothetical protein [Brevibacillus centrosporus]MED4907950.1 hypothetical protein [Brevibacillus centrosporus]